MTQMAQMTQYQKGGWIMDRLPSELIDMIIKYLKPHIYKTVLSKLDRPSLYDEHDDYGIKSRMVAFEFHHYYILESYCEDSIGIITHHPSFNEDGVEIAIMDDAMYDIVYDDLIGTEESYIREIYTYLVQEIQSMWSDYIVKHLKLAYGPIEISANWNKKVKYVYDILCHNYYCPFPDGYGKQYISCKGHHTHSVEDYIKLFSSLDKSIEYGIDSILMAYSERIQQLTEGHNISFPDLCKNIIVTRLISYILRRYNTNIHYRDAHKKPHNIPFYLADY